MTDEEIREVDRQWANEVLNSGGQGGKYRSSNLFVYNGTMVSQVRLG
jgi:hypothetical protein